MTAVTPTPRIRRGGRPTGALTIAAVIAVVIPAVVATTGFNWAGGDTTPPGLSPKVFSTAMGYGEWVTLAGAAVMGVLALLMTAQHVATRRDDHRGYVRIVVGIVVGQAMWVLGCLAATATIVSGLAGTPA